jgi:hypothetical protein
LGEGEDMEILELKFILKLLEFEGYKAPLVEIKPESKISIPEQEEICRNLGDRGFLIFTYEITKFKIAAPGKFLLKQDSDDLPLTEQELKILKACAKGAMTPQETDIPVEEQQTVIQSLANRNLIQVKPKHKKIKEVWLTERGKEYLQYEYTSKDKNLVVSLDLMSNYLQFLRESFYEVSPPVSMTTQPVSDDKILLTIRELDTQLATNNRLPIFHLRERLELILSREELDKTLQRLQRLDKIELISLPATSACAFSAEQIDAGIPLERCAPLFFITLK